MVSVYQEPENCETSQMGTLDCIQWPHSTEILEHQILKPWRDLSRTRHNHNGKSDAQEHSSKAMVGVKAYHGPLCTWKNMVRQGQQSMATCPWWQAEVEDKLHILRCTMPNAQQQWNTCLTKLKNWLKEQGTEPQIHNALLNHLKLWGNPTQEQGNRSNQPFGDEHQ